MLAAGLTTLSHGASLGSVGQVTGVRRSSVFQQGRVPRRSFASVSGRAAPQTVSLFGGSGGKSGASKGQAYICRDCGYIEANFEAQPNDYRCPVCNAPKRRFKQYAESVDRNANSTATRKARKAELKGGGGSSGDGPNPTVLAGAGIAILAALYVGLNSAL